jgi:hypothetical protein
MISVMVHARPRRKHAVRKRQTIVTLYPDCAIAYCRQCRQGDHWERPATGPGADQPGATGHDVIPGWKPRLAGRKPRLAGRPGIEAGVRGIRRRMCSDYRRKAAIDRANGRLNNAGSPSAQLPVGSAAVQSPRDTCWSGARCRVPGARADAWNPAGSQISGGPGVVPECHFADNSRACGPGRADRAY